MLHYERTAIIGVGLLGSSLARAFKKYNITKEVVGITRSDTYIKAKEAGVIDRGFSLDDLSNALKGIDLIILCAPVKIIIDLLPDVLNFAKNGSVVTDVGSTKEVIVSVAEKNTRKDVFFIGAHPMAGSAETGYKAGEADLFKERPYVVMNNERTPQRIFDNFLSAVTTIGAKTFLTDPVTHDKAVAGISHLCHVLSISLMNLIGKKNSDQKEYFDFSSRSFLELTRIAASPHSMWEDIFNTNKSNITEILDEYILELKEFKSSILSGNTEQHFEKSNIYRKQLNNLKGID